MSDTQGRLGLPPYDGEERGAFLPFPDTDAETFVQWKGTDVCIDVHCPCGALGHFDGYFAYYLHCPRCGTVYEAGTQVRLKKIDRATVEREDRTVLVQELEVDDDAFSGG